MSPKILKQIRSAVLEHRYILSEHAYDEMEADDFDALDVEAAILTGDIDRVLKNDPRGHRYVIIGTATDELTLVGAVVRFVEHEQLLIVTVYEIK